MATKCGLRAVFVSGGGARIARAVLISGGGACVAAYFMRFFTCECVKCASVAVILFHMFRYVAKLTLKAKDRASSAQYEKVCACLHAHEQLHARSYALRRFRRTPDRVYD